MKTGMIVCGFPGIGKTCVASELERYVDLESSGFNLTERDDEGRAEKMDHWEQAYCQIAFDMAFQGKIVFVSSHKSIRDRLFEMQKKTIFHADIPILIVYPGPENKKNWLERLERRYWISYNCRFPDASKNKAAWKACEKHYDDFISELDGIDLNMEGMENVYRIVVHNAVYNLKDELSSFITTYDTMINGNFAIAMAKDRIKHYKNTVVVENSDETEEDK